MRVRRYRFRAVRNLLAAVLLLAFPWYALGCPLPTREMELHRSERVCLIDPSAIVLTAEREREGRTGDHTILVGVSKYTVQTSYRTSRFNVWPKNPEGATLVVLPTYLRSRPTFIVELVAVEPPARAVRAKLTLDMTAYEQGLVYVVEGERDGEVFRFQLEEPLGREQVLFELLDTTDLPPYTLEFFAADGAPVETTTNIGNFGEQP